MLLKEIIEDRSGHKIIIITTHLSVKTRFEVIGDQAMADTILVWIA